MSTDRVHPEVGAGDPFHAAASQPGFTLTNRTTREQRGLTLYRERSDEIRHVRGSVWSVPSCSRPGVYLVDLAAEICTCGDVPPAGEVCKHQTAATIARAKTGVCSGCGHRFRRRDLYAVGEDNLTFFEGDELCEGCARGHGVL